jgi:hypothetical protein
MKRVIAALVLSLLVASAVNAQPTRDEALAVMKRAATFMTETVAYRGGYVWAVSEDLKTRWGEVPARPSQVWVQAGTPMVGQALLDAWEATGDVYYLNAARRAVDVLVFGQTPHGGWHYFIDFDPKGLPHWYKTRASRFLFGYEEYRHYYGNATYDDGVTSDAAKFLLRFYTTTLETAYRAPLLKALDFVMESQYPNGAWPQRYPLRYEFAHDGLPDYTSFYTLNDGAMFGAIELLVEAYHALGDARYFEAARRGADFVIAVQGPEGQAAWAEQYDTNMRPTAARTHEPAGYVIRESRDAIRILEMFYVLTGDRRYLRPIPACLEWYERVNREAREHGRPPARYYEPGTNLPIYVVGTDRRTSEGYGVQEWRKTPRDGAEVREVVDVAPIRRQYEEVAALDTATARSAYYDRHWGTPGPRVAATADAVAQVIEVLDSRGAWVTDDVMVHEVVDDDRIRPGTHVAIRGIATAVFVRNLRVLTAHVDRPAR